LVLKRTKAIFYRVALLAFETTGTLYFLLLFYYILLIILLDILGFCNKYWHPPPAFHVLLQYPTASSVQIHRCRTCGPNCSHYAWYICYLFWLLGGFKKENLPWSCTYYFFIYFFSICIYISFNLFIKAGQQTVRRSFR